MAFQCLEREPLPSGVSRGLKPALALYAPRYRAEAARMSKSIWTLEKEREKSSAEAGEVAAKYQQVRPVGEGSRQLRTEAAPACSTEGQGA